MAQPSAFSKIKRVKIHFTFLLFVSIVSASGQGYFNKWYFGNQAGLDFNTNPPTPIQGSLNTTEGCASISDFNGNLLFYTDGIKVWNSTHSVMQNGSDLQGNSSSTQSAVILKSLTNSNQFYVFTAPTSGALRYSIVDMSLEGGLGDVTAVKNVVLHPTSTEKVTAIRIPDGSGYWILGHEEGNNIFFAYRLTASGFSANPVLSVTGAVHTGVAGYIGYLKPSHNGKKLALAIRGLDRFELFDFNSLTGAVSNPISFTGTLIYIKAYGVEFSPDNSKLYLSGGLTTSYIRQINLNAGDSLAIVNSTVQIGSPATQFMGAVQLGPDSKIYGAKYNTINLGVINNPNELGTACNYVDNQVVLLTGTQSQAGLPNFFEIKNCPLPVVSLGKDTSLCLGQSIILKAGASDTNSWSTGSSDSILSVNEAGIYWVESTNSCGVTRDSIRITIKLKPQPDLGKDTILCPNQFLILDATNPNASYLWQDNSTNPTFSVIQNGLYWVKVTNTCGSNTDSIRLEYDSLPSVDLGTDTSICQGDVLQLNASNPEAVYLWNNGSTDQRLLVNYPGKFWVKVTSRCGSGSDTIKINLNPLPYLSLGKDTVLCEGESLQFNVNNPNSVYKWQDNSVNPIYEVRQNGLFWVELTNCGVSRDSINVSFLKIPQPDLGIDRELCQESGLLILTISGSAATYLWSTGSTQPIAPIFSPGVYSVKASNGRCSGIDSIRINDCIIEFEMPNLFTPNLDGLNDAFVPSKYQGIMNARLEIFNRWGKSIFKTDNLLTGWNGSVGSEQTTEGTYFWKVEYTTVRNTSTSLSGFVVNSK